MAKDFAIKSADELFEYINQIAQELYTDAEWSGLRTGSFEWLQSKIVAAVGSLVLQYLDLRAKEAYVSTAQLRQDMRNIAANLGLYPRERAGATVTLSVTASDDVAIPKGTRVGTSNGEVFSTTAELALATGTSLSGSVMAVHGAYTQISYRARGDILESLELKKEDVLPDWLCVTVNGVAWTKVDDWSTSGATSKHWLLSFDERNRASIVFGDGVYGARLPADAEVLIDVFAGGGPAGNAVDAGAITSLLDTFSNSGNVDSITNAAAPTGGRGADSLDRIRAQIPAQLRQVAGLVSTEDISQVITAGLGWVADAAAERGYTVVNGTYVPTVTVAAYPYATGITGMSSAQSTELSEFLSQRGAIGIDWSVQDAYGAPLELELEVKLSNRNLKIQKEAEIKAALVSDAGAPFCFDNLGFANEYTDSDILDAVYGVDGVVRAKIKRLGAVPQPYNITGSSSACLSDIELGSNAEDGYYQFVVTGSQDADVHFFRPIKADYIYSEFIRDQSANWLVEEYEYDAATELNDTDGPWLKLDGGKLSFAQRQRVWVADELNGSTYRDKYLLRVSWVDSGGTTHTSYYHVNDTVAPGTVKTAEDADSPISGTAISATFAGTSNTNINIQILRDQTNGNTNTLVTPNGSQLTITHNSQNEVYVSSSPLGTVPVSQYSHIHFSETALDTSTDNWAAIGSALKVRTHITDSLTTGDVWRIYATERNATALTYKNPIHVWRLSAANIIIRFV